jgi:ubiquinone/menaquinone biosynthesis C-methylase UbiE
MTPWQLWAATYDETPNPLLALEMRLLAERLGDIDAHRFLDAASGTGRWMSYLESRGAQVLGIDACHEMLLRSRVQGRSVRADIRRLPLPDDIFDTAICSFALAYMPCVETVLRELGRVAGRIVVSDLHPEAVSAGWKRSFRAGDEVHEIPHHNHSIAALDAAAHRTGLKQEWRIEASFDEPERAIFAQAGKAAAFEQTRRIPAILITSWRR